jgi:hypothetical protein
LFFDSEIVKNLEQTDIRKSNTRSEAAEGGSLIFQRTAHVGYLKIR